LPYPCVVFPHAALLVARDACASFFRCIADRTLRIIPLGIIAIRWRCCAMPAFCAALPILPGKTETGREFAKTCMGAKHTEFAEALKRHGVTKESWFLQKTPQGDMIIVHFEADDVEKTFEVLAKSEAPFDVWFRQQVKSVTGVDLGQPGDEPPPEEIVHM